MITVRDNEPTVLLTAAGDMDQVFADAGLAAPKNLVMIAGKPVLQHALESYCTAFSNVLVAVRDHELVRFETDKVIHKWNPSIRVIPSNPRNRGALVTALCALHDVDLEAPLIVAAGDSALDCDLGDLFDRFYDSTFSAATVTFQSQGSRWSYVALDSNGDVEEVQEKLEISNLATTGTFFFRRALDFVGAAEWCLVNKATTNNQFFTSTALNFIISRGLKVTYFEIPSNAYQSFSSPSDVLGAMNGET